MLYFDYIRCGHSFQTRAADIDTLNKEVTTMIINLYKKVFTKRILQITYFILMMVIFSCNRNIETNRIYDEIDGYWNLTHLAYNTELIIKKWYLYHFLLKQKKKQIH